MPFILENAWCFSASERTYSVRNLGRCVSSYGKTVLLALRKGEHLLRGTGASSLEVCLSSAG